MKILIIQQQKFLLTKNEPHIKKITCELRQKLDFENSLINLTQRCLCSDYVDGYARGMFLFCFSLWYSVWRHYVCSGQWHNYFLQPRQAERASAQSIFL
jgi:hypothetical protein